MVTRGPLRLSRPGALGPIAEPTKSQEAALRRRHATARAAVWREIEAMGWLYRRGATFPYWPAWLDPNGDDA